MIDTHAIRCNIIRLALSGSLTKQQESDGNAADLLARLGICATETDEQPYQLPSTWAWVKLADLYKVNPRVIANDDDDAAFIPMERILAGFRDGFTYERQKWSKASKNHTRFQNGDVAFAKISPSFENRKAFIAHDLPNGIGGGTTELIVLRQPAMFAKYTYYVVLDQRFIKAGSEQFRGIVGQQRVKPAIVKQYLIPVPPYKEQVRIVERIEQAFSILDEIDELQIRYGNNTAVLRNKIIDAGMHGQLTQPQAGDGSVSSLYERLQDEKSEILVQRKGRRDRSILPVDDNYPYDIPSHWRWIRFGEIGLFKKGPFGSALTKALFVEKGADTVKVYEQQHAIQKDANLGRYYISRSYFDSKMSGFEVLPGDIIVSCAGTIGETFIMPNDIEQGIINQALMRITLCDAVDTRFFQYFFDSNLKKSAREESNGTAINNIPPFEVLKNWYFPLPPYEEQIRIADSIDDLLNVLPS